MRFVDDDGRPWVVRDVALLPERTLVEPGHPRAVERYFVNVQGAKRLYLFAEGATRLPDHEQLERQVREAQPMRYPEAQKRWARRRGKVTLHRYADLIPTGPTTRFSKWPSAWPSSGSSIRKGNET